MRVKIDRNEKHRAKNAKRKTLRPTNLPIKLDTGF